MKHIYLLISLLILPLELLAADMNAANLSGYQFSLLDIEKNCIATRNGMSDTLSVQCKGQTMKAVSRACEGFVEGGLENIRLACGGGLWSLGSKCKVEMRGADKGEFNCKI